MNHDVKKYLFDILEAASDIADFVNEIEYEDYAQNKLIRAAVERKFEIIGEALNRVRSADSEFIENISDYRRIIGFRNVIAHGYDSIENELLWSVISKHLPILREEISKLIDL